MHKMRTASVALTSKRIEQTKMFFVKTHFEKSEVKGAERKLFHFTLPTSFAAPVTTETLPGQKV